MKELTFNPQINVQQCVLWQYANSPALRTLLQAKSDFYEQNVTQFWNDWFNDVFNINTATDFGLTVWGEILDFPRQIKSNTGQIHFLTTEQYRTILKGQFLKFRMGGSAPQINEWLNVVFGNKGNVYCLDNLNMTAIPFVFETNPSDEILWLLSNVDFLPRPAGVGYEIRVVGGDVFGFNGSGLQPFNQGTFYKNWNADLDIEQGLYQLSINAPEGATVIINGISGNYQSMTEGTEYTYSIEREGFLPYTGSGILNQDTEITIYQCEIKTNVPDCDVTINNENAFGIYFLKGTSITFNYSVSKKFYTSITDKEITASSNMIINVVLNGFYNEGGYVSNETDSPLTILFNETIPYQFKLQARLYANSGTGSYNYPAGGGGGIVFSSQTFPANSNVQIVSISGGIPSYGYQANYPGGSGVALKINNNLIAVAGGGASSFAGGGGYIGGYASNNFCGFNINGNVQSSLSANKRIGQEGEAFGGNANGNFGGTSYAQIPGKILSADFYNDYRGTNGYFELTFTEVKE